MALPKENLITEVHSRPVLWCEDHPHSRRKCLRDKLWEEVANICGYPTGMEAKMKWKSLKDQYRREMQRIPKPKPGSAAPVLKSKWQYFDLMRFIKDFDEPEKTQMNLRRKRTFEDSFQDDDAWEDEDDIDVVPRADNRTRISPSPDVSFSNPNFGRKSRKIDSENDTMTNITMEKPSFVPNNRGEEEENSDLCFFKSLLPYMHEFSPLERLQVRNSIQNVVLNHYSRRNGEAL